MNPLYIKNFLKAEKGSFDGLIVKIVPLTVLGLWPLFNNFF